MTRRFGASRAGLILALLVGVPASHADEATAFKALKNVGGSLRRAGDKAENPVWYVELSTVLSAKAKNEDLAYLREFKNLTYLQIHGKQFTDDGLLHLKGINSVKTLGLDATKGTDLSLTALAGMTELRDLSLQYMPITDDGLRELKGLKLERLCLNHTRVTDVGMVHLRAIVTLQRLQLDDTQITDEGIRELSRLPNLRLLQVCQTRVTDDSLRHLKACTNLRTLDVSQTGVTAEGVRMLKKALPDVNVTGPKGQ